MDLNIGHVAALHVKLGLRVMLLTLNYHYVTATLTMLLRLSVFSIYY